MVAPVLAIDLTEPTGTTPKDHLATDLHALPSLLCAIPRDVRFVDATSHQIGPSVGISGSQSLTCEGDGYLAYSVDAFGTGYRGW